jgi:NIPSNAP
METKLLVQPGKMGKYQEVEKDMYSFITKAGMKVIGVCHTVIGDTNEVLGLFASEDMGQLQKSSMAMTQDKEYQAIWQRVEPLLTSQTRKIMMPMPTSPIK